MGLFVPRRGWPRSQRSLRAVALGVAVGEIATGALSLSSPTIGWLSLVVVAVGCAFLVVSVVGHVRFPGRPCHCFGALSRRAFGLSGIGRAAVVLLGALVASETVRQPLVQLSLTGRLALLAGGGVIAGAAFTAAAAAAGQQAAPGWAK